MSTFTELDLVENKELRGEHLERLEVLEKVKEIVTLSNSKVLTTKLVAEYYEVPEKTIKTLYGRNREELENNGVITLRGTELQEFKSKLHDISLFGRANAVTLFNLHAVMLMSFYLTKSKVATKIREGIIEDYGFSQDFKFAILKQNNKLLKENEVERILSNIFMDLMIVERSVPFKSYYLDFLLSIEDKKIVVIECDEYGHTNYNKKDEERREKEIEKEYKIIRYNPDSEECITLLINKILKVVKEDLK